MSNSAFQIDFMILNQIVLVILQTLLHVYNRLLLI